EGRPGVQRRSRHQGLTRGRCFVQGSQEAFQGGVDVAQFKGRFGRSNVDNYQLIEALAVAEGAQIRLDAFDGGAGRVGMVNLGQVGQTGNSGARVQNGAGTDIFRPVVQVGQASFRQARLKDIGALLKLADRLLKVRLADVVAAHNELGRRSEIEPLK